MPKHRRALTLLALSDGGTQRPAEVVERSDRAGGLRSDRRSGIGRASSIDRHAGQIQRASTRLCFLISPKAPSITHLTNTTFIHFSGASCVHCRSYFSLPSARAIPACERTHTHTHTRTHTHTHTGALDSVLMFVLNAYCSEDHAASAAMRKTRRLNIRFAKKSIEGLIIKVNKYSPLKAIAALAVAYHW